MSADHSNEKFGRLTVLETERRAKSGSRERVWARCKCECGRESWIRLDSLRGGTTRSCGCHQGPVSHGQTRNRSNSKAYSSYKAMKQRCFDKKHAKYPYYGGRGITVCDRWKNSFEAFLTDMGQPPSGTEIDRYPNNDGNYEPGNCRWATRIEQARNKRNVQMIEHEGQSLPIGAWAMRFGVPSGTFHNWCARYGVDEAFRLALARRNLSAS